MIRNYIWLGSNHWPVFVVTQRQDGQVNQNDFNFKIYVDSWKMVGSICYIAKGNGDALVADLHVVTWL